MQSAISAAAATSKGPVVPPVTRSELPLENLRDYCAEHVGIILKLRQRLELRRQILPNGLSLGVQIGEPGLEEVQVKVSPADDDSNYVGQASCSP